MSCMIWFIICALNTQLYLVCYTAIYSTYSKVCVFFYIPQRKNGSTVQHLCHLSHPRFFHSHLFLQVTRVDGDKLLPYCSQLVQILQLTLHLKSKQGYSLACNLLHHMLRSTALIYPTEYCSIPGGFHWALQDYLPIKVAPKCM